MMKTCCLDQNSINIIFFIKRYINEKIMNCILVDNNSTINILALKIIKELEIYIYIYVHICRGFRLPHARTGGVLIVAHRRVKHTDTIF